MSESKPAENILRQNQTPETSIPSQKACAPEKRKHKYEKKERVTAKKQLLMSESIREKAGDDFDAELPVIDTANPSQLMHSPHAEIKAIDPCDYEPRKRKHCLPQLVARSKRKLIMDDVKGETEMDVGEPYVPDIEPSEPANLQNRPKQNNANVAH